MTRGAINAGQRRAQRRHQRLRVRRPTVEQARVQYADAQGADVFDGLVQLYRGGVAHRVDPVTAGITRCGLSGPWTDAPDSARVCLRCYPWWYA